MKKPKKPIINEKEYIYKLMHDLETKEPKALNLGDMSAGGVGSAYNDLLPYVRTMKTVLAMLVGKC